MDLMGLVEKFINERGSVVVMKEWAALIKAQCEDLTKKQAELESKNLTLTEDVARLKLELGATEDRYAALDRQVQAAKLSRLEDMPERVLQLVLKSPEQRAGTYARAVGMSEPKMTYLLESLGEREYVHGQWFGVDDDGDPRTWSVAPGGRKYLAEHELLD